MDLSIVIPAFNEANRLAEGFRRFDLAVANGEIDVERTELILVDDGSTDETAAIATKLLAPFPHHRVVNLAVNRGKGAAVRTGVAIARGVAIAYMDADMAIDPRTVPQLIDALVDHDIAVGSRALSDSMVETTYIVRSLMGHIFNRMVTAGTGLGLRDTQCGFKAFRAPVARLLFGLVKTDRFAFDVELLLRAHRLGLRIAEVPVQWNTMAGSTVHPASDSFTMVADAFRIRESASYPFRRCPPSSSTPLPTKWTPSELRSPAPRPVVATACRRASWPTAPTWSSCSRCGRPEKWPRAGGRAAGGAGATRSQPADGDLRPARVHEAAGWASHDPGLTWPQQPRLRPRTRRRRHGGAKGAPTTRVGRSVTGTMPR